MHTIPWHELFMVLAVVLGILATLGVPSHPRFGLFPASFTAFLIAAFFT